MTLIDASDLEWMRDDIEFLLPDTCILLAPTNTSNGQGGGSITWGTVAASVACRADFRRGGEGVVGAALQPYRVNMFSLPQSATVLPTYRIVHGGCTYAVQAVNSDASWPICWRVDVMEVK